VTTPSRAEPGDGGRAFKRPSHPIEYAIVLLLERDGAVHAVRTFDNAHAPTERHEHRYIGAEKQEPIVTHGPINDAMHAVEVKLRRGWREMRERTIPTNT